MINNMISINEFKLSQMISSPNIFIIGTKCTGKTTLIKHLYDHFSNIPKKVYFSCYPQLDLGMAASEIYGSLIEVEKYIKNRRTNYYIKGENTLLILDDIDQISNWRTNEFIKDLYMNSKHWGITLIISTSHQHPQTWMRSNTDYAFIISSRFSNRAFKNTYKYWDIPPDLLETFSTYYEYEPLVLDNTYSGQELYSKYLWYRVPHPKRSKAQRIIARWWRRILAKRVLNRLRIGQEIEYMPGIGKYYQEAHDNFHKKLIVNYSPN